MPYKDPKCPSALEAKKRNQRAWTLRHPEKVKLNNEKYRQKILSSRPVPSCACGNSTRFRWLRGTWVCLPCSRKQSQLKDRERRRLKAVEERFISLCASIGTKAAEVFRKHAITHPSFGRASNIKIHNLCLPPDYRHISKDSKDRIYQLNTLLKLPFGNIGWTCQSCSLYSGEYRFFEIDHIIPRHKGGHGRRSNLQVLCPNCHKHKTIGDVMQRTIQKEDDLWEISKNGVALNVTPNP